MYLIISNQGEVEEEAFTLMGASSKDKDSSKIGLFGSGNKYAIATLIREGINFQIYSGLKEFAIETKNVKFRGTEFERIFLNGMPTALTTRMGVGWEVWFALRELVCNAMDEGGYKLITSESFSPYAGTTSVVLPLEGKVKEFFDNYHSYVLNSEPIFNLGEVQIYPGAFNLYRKNICAKPTGLEYDKSLGSYNFDCININESRIIDSLYSAEKTICRAMLGSEDSKLAVEYIKMAYDPDSFEASLSFAYCGALPSKAWYEALKDKVLAPREAKTVIVQEDRSHYTFLEKGLVTLLAETYPDLLVWGKESEVGWVENTNADRSKVEEAWQRLIRLKIADTEIETKIGAFLAKGVTAVYNTRDNLICISEDFIKESNEEEIDLVVMEEYYHSLGYSDGSRDFEAFLMKQIRKGLYKE